MNPLYDVSIRNVIIKCDYCWQPTRMLKLKEILSPLSLARRPHMPGSFMDAPIDKFTYPPSVHDKEEAYYVIYCLDVAQKELTKKIS